MICFYTASRDALEVINSITMAEFAAARAQCETDVYTATAPVHKDKAWANSVYRFWAGTDEYRNRTFKLYPRVNKASWAIQAAVGTKPALIGNNKLQLKYIRGSNYLEVDIDMSSSTIATHILGMVRACFVHFSPTIVSLYLFIFLCKSIAHNVRTLPSPFTYCRSEVCLRP